MNSRLWAPWRSKFIYDRSHKRSCIFCDKPDADKDAENFIITRRAHSFSMLNIYPYNNGHIMVAPYKHIGDLAKLTKTELADMFALVVESKHLLDKALSPEGYNIGMNIGKVSGAGFSQHIHMHIVPRFNGDTNFMPVLSGTKVISESLKELYNRLKTYADTTGD